MGSFDHSRATESYLAHKSVHESAHGCDTERKAAGTFCFNQLQPKMLLATVPGNQHSLGIQMFDMLLRREADATVCQVAASQAQTIDAARDQYFDAAGLSIGSDLQISSLSAVAAATKAVSKNKNIIIFAGGALLANSPASLQISGVDLVASDATAALQELRRLLRLAAPHPSPRL